MSDKRIALVGAMGSGKSSLSKAYASARDCELFDCDGEFEKRYGNIGAFFERFGESAFREKEGEILLEAARSNAGVIDTGGGAVTNRRAMNAIRSACDIVYLCAPTEILKSRIIDSDRPLKAKLDRIVAERAPLYEKYADYTVDTGKRDINGALEALVSSVNGERRRRYDTVLCDADDTLLDFKTAMKHSLLAAAREMGVAASDERVFSEYKKMNDELWKMLERGEITRAELFSVRYRLLVERLGENVDPDAFNEKYTENMKNTRFLLGGAREFLSELKRRGITVHIVTNGFYVMATERLKAIHGGYDRAFISETCGFDKPDRRYFEWVFNELGEPDRSRTVVFGDSPSSDIAGAAAFGLDCCLFKPDGKDCSQADYTAKSYADFLKLI